MGPPPATDSNDPFGWIRRGRPVSGIRRLLGLLRPRRVAWPWLLVVALSAWLLALILVACRSVLAVDLSACFVEPFTEAVVWSAAAGAGVGRNSRRHRPEVLALRREVADAVALVLEAVAGVVDHRLPATVLAVVLGRGRTRSRRRCRGRAEWAGGRADEGERRARARRQERVRLRRPDHVGQIGPGRRRGVAGPPFRPSR